MFGNKRRATEQELSRRQDELLAQITALEKTVRDLTMEWEDWYEKFRNLYARISRRQQREDSAKEPEANGDGPMNPAAARLLSLGGPR